MSEQKRVRRVHTREFKAETVKLVREGGGSVGHAFPVAVMSRMLAVSTSGYYAWKARPGSSRSRRDLEPGDRDKIRRNWTGIDPDGNVWADDGTGQGTMIGHVDDCT